VRDEAPLASIAKRLDGTPTGNGRPKAEKAEGEVSMVLMLGAGTEVEVKLPGRYPVSPQIAGALKAVPGVVAVETI
jgi:DNA polymerase-3 subunit alpha